MARHRIISGPDESALRSAADNGGPLTFTLEGRGAITLERTSTVLDGGKHGWRLIGHIGDGELHYEVDGYHPRTGRGFLTEEPHD